MFYHIEGSVSHIESNFSVIDCNGVGYLLYITTNTAASIEIGKRTKLYVTESIGEGNFDLYGFYTVSEKKCFDMLVSVSGIGPKAALSILSYNTPEMLAKAVINNDDKSLTAAPGIGKKTALRIILELKDKLGKEYSDLPYIPASAANAPDKSKTNDAFAALSILGYTNSEISKALAGVNAAAMTTEEIIKATLKNIDK